MQNNTSLTVLLAGLLHDIGKFYQRADLGYHEAGNQLGQTSRNIAEYICPKTKDGYFGFQHVIWTHELLHRHEKLFSDLQLYHTDQSQDNLVNLASYHHRPTTALQALVQVADWWSSGLDRSAETEYATEVNWGKSKYRSIPLSPLFQNILVDEKSPAKLVEYGYPLTELQLDPAAFPAPVSLSSNLQQAYKDQWARFYEEFKKLAATTAEHYVFSLYHLLKKYCRAIPASTRDYPDSSLFEHLKTTGAIAQALYEYWQNEPGSFSYDEQKKRLDINDGHYPLSLVCGDFSGIQSFIYQISSRGAARSLKGRSFYLQNMAETAALQILTQTGFTICNQVYAAGGKFYLILPNLAGIRQKTESAFAQLSKILWDQFEGKISLNHASIDFTFLRNTGVHPSIRTTDAADEHIHIGQLWHRLAQKTSAKKGRKFDSIILDSSRFSSLFTPFGAGGDEMVCAVTGKEITASNSEIIDRENPDEQDFRVSKEVALQAKIGKALAGHDYLTLSDQRLPHVNGLQYQPLKQDWLGIFDKNEISSIDNATVLKTIRGKADFLDLIKGKNNGYGFRLYGGSTMARHGGRNANKTFEELAGDLPFKRIGVLRMDVDNLGQLFINGIPPKSRSFSALATLSEQLDFFFSGYLNYIRELEEFRDWVNIIYAGGDDVFAVGRWDKIIRFAIRARSEFKKWVCNRNDITLSAGIAVVRPKFPIAKAAELAGEAEDRAKEYVFSQAGLSLLKNSLNLFGISVNWEHEMPFVETFKDDLVGWIARDKLLSKGVLMKIFQFYESYKRQMTDWNWQAAYSFARMAKSSSQSAPALNKIKILLFSHSYGEYKNIRFEAVILACRWAELEIRNHE